MVVVVVVWVGGWVGGGGGVGGWVGGGGGVRLGQAGGWWSTVPAAACTRCYRASPRHRPPCLNPTLPAPSVSPFLPPPPQAACDRLGAMSRQGGPAGGGNSETLLELLASFFALVGGAWGGGGTGRGEGGGPACVRGRGGTCGRCWHRRQLVVALLMPPIDAHLCGPLPPPLPNHAQYEGVFSAGWAPTKGADAEALRWWVGRGWRAEEETRPARRLPRPGRSCTALCYPSARLLVQFSCPPPPLPPPRLCSVLRRVRVDTWGARLRHERWDKEGYCCSVEDPFDRCVGWWVGAWNGGGVCVREGVGGAVHEWQRD